ncbi:S-adenosyl-L-methionine-dependent methyltransferase [Pilobolus umbonatus]|nr:S-adenosyl-L-methionine-dependent methyltransferase [Pilobolus umbonatus]
MSDNEENIVIPEQSIGGAYEGKHYQFVDGRRYNNDNDVAYLLPNDIDEADRLQLQHIIFKYILQCIYHAPVREKLIEGISVLDAGCGPGVWTFDMAETYPESKFTGVDISFVFPETVEQTNVELQVCNITKEMPFEDESFDYIHQRLLLFALSRNDFLESLKNAYRLLKPGGYIEMVEPNMKSFHNIGPLMTELGSYIDAMMNMKGMLSDIGENLEILLEEAGFENIEVEIKRLPINHSGRVGELWWKDFKHGYSNLRPMIAMINPKFNEPDSYTEFLDSVAEECAAIETDMILFIAYAQKPMTE